MTLKGNYKTKLTDLADLDQGLEDTRGRHFLVQDQETGTIETPEDYRDQVETIGEGNQIGGIGGKSK